jgi:DNA-directed RNA polymerase specialized sigma24 family protein
LIIIDPLDDQDFGPIRLRALARIATKAASANAGQGTPRHDDLEHEAFHKLTSEPQLGRIVSAGPGAERLARKIAADAVVDCLRKVRRQIGVDRAGPTWAEREECFSQLPPVVGEDGSTRDATPDDLFDYMTSWWAEQRLQRLADGLIDNLTRLPGVESAIFWLHGISGLSARETSTVLGISPGEVRCKKDLVVRKLKNIPPRPFIRKPDNPWRVWP